jgi:hypothetical protein
MTEVRTSLNDVGESLRTFGGACLTVVLPGGLPGIEKVDIALGETCDFDQPVWLGSADKRAKLVDVARRYTRIDADIATSANDRISVDNFGDCTITRAEYHRYSEDEWQEEIEKDAEEHTG